MTYEKLILEQAFEELKELRDDFTNTAIDCMKESEQFQEDPLLGLFWYDVNNDELFGINSTPARDCNWYYSKQFGIKLKTDRRLHKNIWNKELHRKKDRRFSGDYSIIPRGRVFEIEDGTYRVYVGSWIDKYPMSKELIIDEFNLPIDKTTFVKDIHWEQGHGWSDEF